MFILIPKSKVFFFLFLLVLLGPNKVRGDLFSESVYPVLRQNCFECHGPDKRKGGLRLDRKREAMLGGDSGPVIIAGDSLKSSLYKLIAKIEDGKQMPPKGDLLPSESIATIKQWIDSGAVWPTSLADGLKELQPKHWAFQTPKRPIPPLIQNKLWPNNAIDNFVLSKLEKEGIDPSPRAKKSMLIRRLSFDLLGIPPSAEEVRQFLQNNSQDSYIQLVDKLIASDAFGEHWGRFWLDKARYADSDGYEKDNVRPTAWVWRDWVIDAINKDIPYDQFSIKQIAGDMLPGADVNEQLATGFHRNTLHNTEGGTDQEEFRIKAVVDRLSTAGSIWLGLTIGCAECHTHKYDPITQREFYEMMAFFNTSNDHTIQAPNDEELISFKILNEDWNKSKKKIEGDLDSYLKNEAPKKQIDWEKDFSQNIPDWSVFAAKELVSTGKVELTADSEGVIRAGGENPEIATYTIVGATSLKKITGFRLTTVKVNKKGAGRADNGNFVINQFRAELLLSDGRTQPIPFKAVEASHSQNNFDVGNTIDGKIGSNSGWAVSPKINQDNFAIFASNPISVPLDAKIRITIVQSHGKKHTLGGLRLEVTESSSSSIFNSIPITVTAALNVSVNNRSEKQTAIIQNWFLSNVDEKGKALQKKLNDHIKLAPKYPGPKANVVIEQSKRRKTYIHVRGDFLRKGPEVKPSTLSVLHPLRSIKEANRLDFSKWIFDSKNPLTSRVSVNYIWQNLFGSGLVKTVDDFGVRGDFPSHPKLLDWLANELQRLNWSRKELIRIIVTSETYQQSSSVRGDLQVNDADNRWLARQNRFRLSAEGVRDTQLYAAGLLSLRKYGPSIRPPLPSDIAALGYANSVKWKASTGENKYRRGVYIHAQRTVPYPMLTTFDANDTSVACMRRENSNTPLQALTLLNDPVFFESAQALGRLMSEETGSLSQQIIYGFERCLSRPITNFEISRLMKFYEDQKKLILATPQSAEKITGIKGGTSNLAAFISLARVILNLDETVTRE